MDILGIGIPEILIVILILLVVAGPRRMVRWGYIMGHEVGKLRAMWEETRKMIREEIDAAGLSDELRELKQTGQDLQKNLDRARKPLSPTSRMKSYNPFNPSPDNGAEETKPPQPYTSEAPQTNVEKMSEEEEEEEEADDTRTSSPEN